MFVCLSVCVREKCNIVYFSPYFHMNKPSIRENEVSYTVAVTFFNTWKFRFAVPHTKGRRLHKELNKMANTTTVIKTDQMFDAAEYPPFVMSPGNDPS